MPIDLQIDTDLEPPVDLQLGELQQVQSAVAAELVAADLDDERLDFEVCVRICDADESAQLNNAYRGKNKPTNVLSFPADMDLPQAQVLGDLAICWPVVCAEAQAQQKSLQHHLNHLFVHGLLHLLGFDHEDDTEAKAMESLEIRILQRLHIANPYEC